VTGRACFARSEQSPRSLVQQRRKRFEASLDGNSVDHAARINAPAATSRRFRDSFVAFLPPSRFFPSDSVAQAQALRTGKLLVPYHRPLTGTGHVELLEGRYRAAEAVVSPHLGLATGPGER
jgi:hypothetical protein